MNDSSRGRSTESTRRRLLAGTGSLGLIGLAGCLGGRDGPVPEPAVTSGRIDDWRQIDESQSTAFERSYGPVTVRARERTRIYEYVDVAEALAELTDASGSPVVFFATRIDLRPAVDQLPAGIGRDRLMEEVESAAVEAFRGQLRNAGIEGVDVVDEGVTTVRSGHTATAWRLAGTYALGGEIPLPDGATTTFEQTVEMESRLGVWHDGTDVIVAGGAYPTDPLIEVIDEALPDLVDAETVVTELAGEDAADALATDPAAFDEDVSQLLISVE